MSELFHCTNGTRQGCIISPLMFILYLNELSKQLVRNECKGIYIDENHQNTNLLLFADDLVLFGDNVGRLQDLLNNLSVFCKRWGLSVNMSKTNFMVFRNGGIIKKNEKVYFDGRLIDNCTYYKYLGVVMSTRLSWSPAQKTLSQQAGKALNVIKKLNYNCNFSFVCGNELFDKCVLPVLTYGAEVWGTSVHSSIEQVLCKFCRHQLGVGSKAPTPAVLGECGRNSLYVQCYLKCVKYWLKLISSEEGTLLRSCYEMLVVYCNAGRSNWATDIKNMFYSLGYGYVWENQSVENPAIFIREFRMRLLDCDLQKWSQDLSNMPKLRTYQLFKSILEPEPYLLLYIPRKIRSSLAKFRLSNHTLEIEVGRHNNIPSDQRFCKLCVTLNQYIIEDEYHVLLSCPFYTELRSIYLDFIDGPSNLHSFTEIMSSSDEIIITRLGIYVTNMFRLRESLLLSL